MNPRPHVCWLGMIALPCLAWVGVQSWTKLHQARLCAQEYEPPPPGMVLVPAGEFWMGSDDPNAEPDEKPLRKVFVPAFYIDQFEVTNRRYKEFKNDHPGWNSLGLKEMAKHFKVDYLIYLEIDSMSLYETGSQKTLYYGRTNITASVLNANKPDESPNPKTFTCEYPKSKGPISVDESTPPRAFYMAFMNFIAKRLSWYFAPHEIKQDITCE